MFKILSALNLKLWTSIQKSLGFLVKTLQ